MDTASWIRLEDFSCGIFFMFQVMGTLMLYLKGRTHRLQRAVFWLMFYLLAISSFEFYVFFIDNFLGSQMRPVTNLNQQLHTSFYEYVNQWRVRRAKELLRASNAPLEEIALQSGFNSMSSFRRYFAAHTGMSPLEYRKGNFTK